MKTKQELLDEMNGELYELGRNKVKKVKGKRVDEHGRRMFDSSGKYIPKENRISNSIAGEVKKSSDKEVKRKMWYRNYIRQLNQKQSEEIEYGK
jgi:hypothetical protein|tara:strand:+ start:346 stop:627 length:282 start_codon:yes stop_codon:yes gene_type:complete